jgi:raffinose/stachyose/melibiose transport system substrate-binding protein
MKQRWMKKSMLTVAIGSMTVLAACGHTDNASSDKSNDASSAKSAQKITITMEAGQAMKANYPYVFYQANLDEFEKKHNIKVNLVIDPDNQVKNILQTKLATNEPPDVVVFNKVAAENELNSAKNMTDLSGEAWVQRLSNPKDLTAPDGKTYGFVMQSPLDAQAIVYNKQIFEELKLTVPKSYDEFLAVCEAIKKAGITPIFGPFKDQWTFQIWAAGPFGYVASKDKPGLWDDINANKVKFADIKEFEDILSKGLDLYKKGYISKSALSDDYNMAPDVFSKKKAAMMIMGDWFISDMAKKDPNVKLGLFPVPAFNGKELMISRSQLESMVFVPKSAKHANEAKLFVDFISQKEQMDRAQVAKPFMPSVKDASAPKLTPIQQEIYDMYVKTNKVTVEMNAFMKVDMAELWKYYQDMIAGGKTPHEVLAAWDKKFGELMKAGKQQGF